MYSFHFVSPPLFGYYWIVQLFISPLMCLFFLSPLHLPPSVYLARPPFLSLSLPSLFIPSFPTSPLGPSVLALRLLLSLPSARLSPCLCDVKYHPFTHLHLIFSRPSPSPFHHPLIFSHLWLQPSPSCWSLYMFPSFLHLFFSTPIALSVSLNEPFRGCQSSASPPYPSEHASAERR